MAKEKPATKICKHCKTEIPYEAKVCPQCRKKQGGVLKWVIICIVAIFIIGAATGGGDDESKEADNTSSANNTQSAQNEPEETEQEVEPLTESEEAEEATSNIFHVGDVLETKKARLSYLSCGDYTDDNMFVEAGEGNKLIYFEFEFENIGDTDTSVGYLDFSCYADGYEAKDTMSTADNAMTPITTLSPGRKTSGIVVFEVPQDSESIEVEYETSYWTQDKAIFMYEQ